MKRSVIIFGTIISVMVACAARGQDKTRFEKDLIGEKEIPAEAYYGVQTARALENFQISGVQINHYPGFVEAWAIVKLAAARANTDVGAMKPEALQAIEKACKAVRFRKRARNNEIGNCAHEIDDGLAAKVVVGFVNEDDGLRRAAREFQDLVASGHGSRRAVGIGDGDDLCPRGDGCG